MMFSAPVALMGVVTANDLKKMVAVAYLTLAKEESLGL